VIRTNAYATLAIIFALLFTLGFACNQSETPPPAATTNSAADPSNAKAATDPATTGLDIAGSYTVTGTNENGGSPYAGSLQVTKRDEVYQFSWNTAGKSMDGVGVQTDNSVAVAFTEGDDGKGCGVVLYKIGSDGSLDGKAGYWGVNSSETETAKSIKGTGIEGEYDVTGTNTDGKEYKGKLAVNKSGAGYTFAWDAGGTFAGFGITTGDKVAVGLGGKKCGFVAYELKGDGTLEGKWGGQGNTSFGTETAKKK
jgi:hypothetical protein